MTENLIHDTKYLKQDYTLTVTMILSFAACIPVFLYLTGDIGFQGDDWWIFSIARWNKFPESLLIYAQESKRPIEGLYWTSLYEIFGLNEPAFLAGSLILLALSCVMMSKCLLRAFPDQTRWAVMSGMLSFVMTPLANLVFMLHTDNSRISCLFFWISCWLFQSWAKESEKISKLALPILFYCLATLTYENCALLIFAVPFLVFPVFKQSAEYKSTINFFLKLTISITIGFTLFLSIRFMVFGGGAVGHKSLIPSLELALSYVRVLCQYMSYPLQSIRYDPGSLIWAVLFSFFVFLVLKCFPRSLSEKTQPSGKLSKGFNYFWMIMSSFAILGMGIAPYLLAGYSPELGFTSQSRIFSSAGFGIAAIVCLPLALSSGYEKINRIIEYGLLIFVFLSSFSQISLRNDWIQAKVFRDSVTASLLKQVPDVKDGANFLFLDLQWYLSNNAVVFQGVDGLTEWVKILYGNPKINGYFLYSQTTENEDQEKKAKISSGGVTARGSAVHGPLPLDSLILMERKGDKLLKIERIAKDEDRILARWEDVETIHTNRNLINDK